MHRIEDVLHLVFGVGHFTGENAGGRRLTIMLFTLPWRELVAAIRTRRIRRVNYRLALGAFFGRRFAVARAPVLDLQGINRAVPEDVPAEVENQAVLFGRVWPESSTHHLVIEARRVRRAQQRHAVDIGCVEAGGQNVHVDQVRQLTAFEARQRFGAVERQRVPTDESALSTHAVHHSLHVQGVLYAGCEDQDAVAVLRVLDNLAACRPDE